MLMAAVLWFAVGSLTWVVVLGHTIKGTYTWWWPEFELPPITVLGKTLPGMVGGWQSVLLGRGTASN
jgi:hypothetical protein